MAEDNSYYQARLAKLRDATRKRRAALGDRRCKCCGKPVHGRIDKVFCSKGCGDRYHYFEHVEESRARAREVARKGAQKRSGYWRKYYLEHREKILAYASRYEHEHPEVYRATRHKRRAQCAKGPNHTRYDELKLYNRVHGECAYCGRHVEFKDGQFDHRIPLSKGGNNGIGNIEWTCAHCNMSKKDKLLSEWLHKEES